MIRLVMNVLFVFGCCYHVVVHGFGVVAVRVRKLFACMGVDAVKQTLQHHMASGPPEEVKLLLNDLPMLRS